jgi:hypothetical protein
MNPPVSAPAIKIVKSVREQVSAQEWMRASISPLRSPDCNVRHDRIDREPHFLPRSQAFNTLFRLERACQVQVMALSCNTRLTIPATDILEKQQFSVRMSRNCSCGGGGGVRTKVVCSGGAVF